MFFWNYLAFSMIQQMLAIWSLVLLPFLNPAWTSGSSQFMFMKPGLENCEHYFTSVWDECNFVVVWAFFGIAFLWNWNENWPFPVLWPLLSFPDLLAYWGQHFHSIIFQEYQLFFIMISLHSIQYLYHNLAQSFSCFKTSALLLIFLIIHCSVCLCVYDF